MTDDIIKKTSRRKVIAILGSVGVDAAVVRSVVSGNGSTPDTENLPDPQGTAGEVTIGERIREERVAESSG
jgi:hypothetical protein